MFTGYNDNFPYSYVTEKLVRGFPSWTKIRKDPNSIGQQFLNVFGLMMEEIERYLDESLKNQYIGSASLGEVAWLYKVNVASEVLKFKQKKTISVTGLIEDTPIELKEMVSLHDFYASKDPHVYIVDYEENIIYLKYLNDARKTYDFLTVVDGEQELTFTEFLPHHVWNVFDEFALLLNLRRRRLETNAELKERILDVFRFPANATKIGLLRGIGRELGLVRRVRWPEETESYDITDQAVIPETIIIKGGVPLPGQIKVEDDKAIIRSLIDVLSLPKKDARFEGTFFTLDNELVLNQGVTEGYYISPVIAPRDLKYWKNLAADFNGEVTFDIISYNFESLPDPNTGRFVADLRVADPTGQNHEEFKDEEGNSIEINMPVRVVIKLKQTEEADPVVRSVTLGYLHRNDDEDDIAYIYGLKLNTLHDEKFLRTLFNSDGSPGETLLRYVKELNELVPIMWGSFRWDESYWDVVGKNLMGLHVLPNIWDPRLSEVSNELFQTGIGDGPDLKVRFKDNWCPQIHSGHYYLTTKETLPVYSEDGYYVIYTTDSDPQFITLSLPQTKVKTKLVKVERNKITFQIIGTPEDPIEEANVLYRTKHYLFADCKIKEAQDTDEITFGEDRPAQDTVVIVEADGKILKEVAFLTDSMIPSIVNKEAIKGLGRDEFYLKYGPAFDVKINGEAIDDSLVNDNEVKYKVNEGEEVEVTYKVKDTFVFFYDEENKPKILLSDVYNQIKVYYEGTAESNYYQADTPELNPIKSHITSGFIYLTNQIPQLDHFDISASPDAIRGDGISQGFIVVDAFDVRNIPVLNIGPGKEKEISVSVSLIVDETEEELPVAGEVIHRATYYNRNVYVYKSPSEEYLPDRDDESGRKKPCTAIITFACGQVEEQMAIKVR